MPQVPLLYMYSESLYVVILVLVLLFLFSYANVVMCIHIMAYIDFQDY